MVAGVSASTGQHGVEGAENVLTPSPMSEGTRVGVHWEGELWELRYFWGSVTKYRPESGPESYGVRSYDGEGPWEVSDGTCQHDSRRQRVYHLAPGTVFCVTQMHLIVIANQRVPYHRKNMFSAYRA